MNINPRSILGGIPGLFDETEFEKESPLGGVFEAISDLGNDLSEKKFPSKGSIEFNKANEESQKQKEKAQKAKAFFQGLKEDADRAQKAKDRILFEEEIWDIITSLPTEQKNELLHYQASYRDRSIYQKAALRRKIIEGRKKEENKEKAASIPSPAKQANALETAFEGGSGKQGGGSSNLSNQAVG